MLLRSVCVWLLIACAETAHGILRVRLLNRRLGDRRARQVGVFSGSLIILVLVWAMIPWIGAASLANCLAVGLLWLVLMLAFDFGLGRLYFGFSWKRIFADLDPRQGGFLGIGMMILFLSPLIAASLRGHL
jgi:hypothetical protein